MVEVSSRTEGKEKDLDLSRRKKRISLQFEHE